MSIAFVSLSRKNPLLWQLRSACFFNYTSLVSKAQDTPISDSPRLLPISSTRQNACNFVRILTCFSELYNHLRRTFIASVRLPFLFLRERNIRVHQQKVLLKRVWAYHACLLCTYFRLIITNGAVEIFFQRSRKHLFPLKDLISMHFRAIPFCICISVCSKTGLLDVIVVSSVRCFCVCLGFSLVCRIGLIVVLTADSFKKIWN